MSSKFRKLLSFLSNGREVEDSSPVDLSSHDDRYHEGHFDPTKETCSLREEMGGRDAPDSNLANANNCKEPNQMASGKRRHQDGMYSKIGKVLDQAKQAKFGASSVLQFLRGRGIKEDEIKATGLEGFLIGKKSVSKKEIDDWIQSHNYILYRNELRELKGETDSEKVINSPELPESVAQSIADSINESFCYGNEIYGAEDFHTSGKEARENLLHGEIPDGMKRPTEDEIDEIFGLAYDESAFSNEGQGTLFDRYASKHGSNYREVVFSDPDITYRKSHWGSGGQWGGDRDDVVAHTRLQDMTVYGPDFAKMWDMRRKYDQEASPFSYQGEDLEDRKGEIERACREKFGCGLGELSSRIGVFHNPTEKPLGKCLFVEEVQSDLHQEGKNKGYFETDTLRRDEDNLAALEKKVLASREAAGDAWRDFSTRFGALAMRGSYDEKDKAEAEAKYNEIVKASIDAEEELEKARTDFNLHHGQGNPPDIPYKNTWQEYVMKQNFIEACTNGYDYVAWTTGDMQADRYDLSKHLDYINVEEKADGTFDVRGYKDEDDVINTTCENKEELADTIGKDLAKRVTNGEFSVLDATDDGTQLHVIEQEGLRVGGEGMHDFYDVGGRSSQNIPKFVQKYIRQWGGKLEELSLPDGTPVVGFKIPDAMRKEISENGLPAFDEIDGSMLRIMDGKTEDEKISDYLKTISNEDALDGLGFSYSPMSSDEKVKPIRATMKKVLKRRGSKPLNWKEHDEHFHDGHFDPNTMTCSLREKMGVENGVDKNQTDRGTQENEEFQAEYSKWHNPDGSAKEGWMMAPNGKPSNLSERQWVQVRTPSFKKWFGDWEKDKDGASKILDQNGEPMQVFHGTVRKFESFSPDKASGSNYFGKCFYFTSSERDAEKNYAGIDTPDRLMSIWNEVDDAGDIDQVENAMNRRGLDTGNESVMPCFVNMKKPFVVGGTDKGANEVSGQIRDAVRKCAGNLFVSKHWKYNPEKDEYELNQTQNEEDVEDFMRAFDDRLGWASRPDDMASAIKDTIDRPYFRDKYKRAKEDFLNDVLKGAGYDGIIDYGAKERFPEMKNMTNKTFHVMSFYPNSIKSSTGNTGTFSSENQNIYDRENSIDSKVSDLESSLTDKADGSVKETMVDDYGYTITKVDTPSHIKDLVQKYRDSISRKKEYRQSHFGEDTRKDDDTSMRLADECYKAYQDLDDVMQKDGYSFAEGFSLQQSDIPGKIFKTTHVG